MSKAHSGDDKKNSSCGNESISGNALLVNVQNSNETPKMSQEPPPLSYQPHMSNAPKFPLPLNQDNGGRSVMGINEYTSCTNMLSNSLMKNHPPTNPASSISSSLNYNKSPLPQDADHGDNSNKNIIRNISDNSIATYKSNIAEKICSSTYSSDANVSSTETKKTGELNETCEPTSIVVGSSVRTEISDKRDNKLTYETAANNAGAIEDDVVTMVKSSQVFSVVSNKPTLQSHKGTKSESHQNPMSLNVVDSSLQNKGDLCVRKDNDSTTNSSFSSETPIDITTSFDTSKSSSKNLAALEEAIAEKKATAMLPIQKLSSMPPKNTTSFFSGSGGILKTGSGNSSGGSKLVDSLLKQAEARAAKEASVAAAAANAKKNNTKEDMSKGIPLITPTKGNRMDTEEKKSSIVDNVKGKKCIIFVITPTLSFYKV